MNFRGAFNHIQNDKKIQELVDPPKFKSQDDVEDEIRCRYCGKIDISKSGVCPDCDYKYERKNERKYDRNKKKRGMKESRTNESMKIRKSIRRRRKEKAKMREAELEISESTVKASDMSAASFAEYLETKELTFLKGMVGHFDPAKEKLIKKAIDKKGTKESVNEDSMLTGGATVPNDPNFANPDVQSEPLEKEQKAEETDTPEEPKEDEREIPLEGDKEYLGNRGGEDYFYFVIIPAEDGTKDLQIQDASDDVVFSAKENEIDVSNTEDFLWKGIQELELSNISLEVVDKYLLPDEKEQDVEMEAEEGAGSDIGLQQSRNKTKTPESEVSNIKTPGGFIPKQGMGESKVTEEQYKNDADIASEFNNFEIKNIEVNDSGNSGWIEIDFPEGGEHVGGGTDTVVDHWIKYSPTKWVVSKIAFDNWYPDAVYSVLSQAIEDKLSNVGESVDIGIKEVQTMVNDARMKKLLEKYDLMEAFETKEAFIEFVQNTIIPELEYSKMDDAVKAFYEAFKWMGGAEWEPGEEPNGDYPEGEALDFFPDRDKEKDNKKTPKKKTYNIDVDNLYKTGDVGEAKMKDLLEKFGLSESKIDVLMEKFDLLDERSPRGIEDLDQVGAPAVAGGPSPDILVEPGDEPIAGPGEEHTSADSEPAPDGGDPKAEDMSSPESARANIEMQYPEEPFISTALAYADSLVDEPKVYGAIRNLKWLGIYANSETFLKQAKIVGNYNEFNPDIAKRLVDAVGDGAKFRLAREGSVAVYFTIRDMDKKISLDTLGDMVRATAVDSTGNPGEARVWWGLHTNKEETGNA